MLTKTVRFDDVTHLSFVGAFTLLVTMTLLLAHHAECFRDDLRFEYDAFYGEVTVTR